jgi:hypothetical protein
VIFPEERSRFSGECATALRGVLDARGIALEVRELLGELKQRQHAVAIKLTVV